MVDSRPLALVTGASSGIGLELAKQFVEHGYDLLINAEDGALGTVAAQLGSSGVSVQSIRANLRTAEGVEWLWEQVAVTGRSLDAAALNAGVGESGPLLETDLAAELEIIDVNVRSTVQLAKRVLRMIPPISLAGSGKERRNGRGWFPRSLLSGRRVRHPAVPLRHRHDYAVDFHHGLPTRATETQPGVPPS